MGGTLYTNGGILSGSVADFESYDAIRRTPTVDGPVDLQLVGAGTLDLSDELGATSANVTADFTGNLTLTTGSGNDRLVGGFGNDAIQSGTGNDLIDGGGGNDLLDGGAGDDTIFDGQGTTGTIQGGDGNDTIFVAYQTGGTIDGGTGRDTFRVSNGNLLQLSLTGIEVLETGFGTVTGTAGQFDDVETILTLNQAGYEMTGVTLHVTSGSADLSEELGARAVTLTTGAGGATITAGSGNDTMTGGEGADSLDGGTGNDRLFGGFGGDVLVGSGGADTAEGGDGSDILFGGAGADVLRGGERNDTIDGDGDDDMIEGGSGNDVIDGGSGNDAIQGNQGEDSIDGGEGDDSIWDGQLTSSDSDTDRLSGGAGNDYLFGGRGDFLYGGAGDDQLTGNASGLIDAGAGNDVIELGTYLDSTVLGGEGDDVILAAFDLGDSFDGGTGTDRIINTNGDVSLRLDDAAIAGVEILSSTGDVYATVTTFSGFSSINADVRYDTTASAPEAVALAVSLILTDGGTLDLTEALDGLRAATVRASAFGNTVTGGTFGDSFIGGAGDDVFIGAGGDDQFTGGGGKNTFIGGEGTDRAVFAGNAADYAWTLTGDTLFVYGAADGTEVFLTGVEFMVFADGEVEVPVIPPGVTIYGTSGNDTVSATRTVAGQPLPTTRDDTIITYGGNDRLDGGAGADLMQGGAGNDTYTVDDAGDRTDEIDSLGNDTGGTDSVSASLDWTLAAFVENLTLTGGAVMGTGNGLANRITGTALANTLAGLGGNDQLYGGDGDDDLAGGDGNDRLEGGAGDDTMRGGAGNDSYIIDRTGDVASESGGSGIDQVTASVSFVLADGIENLTLTGTGDISGTGNGLNNRITGNGGENLLIGGEGNDQLYGGEGDDDLFGGAGNDVLNGGTGGLTNRDIMNGGAGNDTYTVDSVQDIAIEVDGFGGDQGGTDSVSASVSWTLSEFFENLTLTGTGDFSGTGNGLNNRITGNGGENLLTGGDGNDQLYGGVGDDDLFGGAGNDVLNGGTGGLTNRDIMNGGAGNDTYTVDSVQDIAIEDNGAGGDPGGTDSVSASVSWILGDFFENLTLTGTGDFSGTGNGLSNRINGNAGANTLTGGEGNDTLSGAAEADALYGGAGNDSLIGGSEADLLHGGGGNDALTGGTGADSFVFDTAPAAGGIDRIADFEAGSDTLQLDPVAFPGLVATPDGTLDPAQFALGSVAADADDRIIYDPLTGKLYFDIDGSGAGARVQIASLSGSPSLTAADILVS